MTLILGILKVLYGRRPQANTKVPSVFLKYIKKQGDQSDIIMQRPSSQLQRTVEIDIVMLHLNSR